MANDVRPGEILATVPVQGSRAPTTATEASGKLKPQVTKQYRLTEAAQALNDMMQRKVTGKVVLVP